METETKNYEIAYLLSPSLTEEDALEYAGKISGLLDTEKGVVRRQEPPRKRQLAYPVKKEKHAYFGWTTFNILPEFLDGFKKRLTELANILRYVIILEEKKPELNRHAFNLPIKEGAKSFSPKSASQIPSTEEKPEEKLDLEALDKKLEEILGK